MIKLCADFSAFKSSNEIRTGVGINAVSILKEVIKDKKIKCDIVGVKSVIGVLKTLLTDASYKIIDSEISHFNDNAINIRILIPRKIIKKGNYDVVFLPRLGAFNYISKDTHYIAILHDLDFLQKNTLKNQVRRILLKYFISRIDCTVVISNYVKQELMSWLSKIDKTKLKVIYNSIDIKRNSVKTNRYINDKYILCINSFKESKNHITLLKAYGLIKDQITQLLVLDGYGDASSIKKYIIMHNLENKVKILQNLTDKEVINLYENASIFVTTSMFEGFGRTPIEAALYELPVVSSKDTSLYEVTKGLVEYYEPSRDYHMLAKVLKGVICGDIKYGEKRRKLIKKEFEDTYSKAIIGEKYRQLIYALTQNMIKKEG